ncbi:MAG: hypothetical protein FJX68_02490 [Alphaproteobacteria bacterium]|nr:hypothetical protein [Alphaproteobacteria bacterium]
MKGKACLVVRATVPEADRKAFDKWYQDEHLGDALKTFGAERAWRCWSKNDPAVHCAYYLFPSVAKAEAVQQFPGTRRLVADFDATWQGRVTRTREVLEYAQALDP